ncbi:hypothetical protein DY885_15370, partial [Vibrio parahaemolyticus]|nr:hypothetical protein [Vibrio parahaemolyticus]
YILGDFSNDSFCIGKVKEFVELKSMKLDLHHNLKPNPLTEYLDYDYGSLLINEPQRSSGS